MNSENKEITDGCVNELFEEISDVKVMTEIQMNLEGNPISDKGAQILVNNINKLPNIEQLHLYLNDTQIGDKGLVSLFKAFEQQKNLSQLSLTLKGDLITLQGIKQLETIKSLKKVKNLSFGFNRFSLGVEFIKSLTKFISKNQDIIELGLFIQDCEIGNEGTVYISECLQSLKKLQSLSLQIDYNSITDNGVLNIIRSISSNTNLKHLNLNICHYTIENLDYLEKLQYHHSFNVISEQCVKKIIHTIGNQLALTTLNLNIQHYSNESYLNFNKEGYEGLLAEKNNNSAEMQSFINLHLNKIPQKFIDY